RIRRAESGDELITTVLVEDLVEAQHIPRLGGREDALADAFGAGLHVGDRRQRALRTGFHSPRTELHVVGQHPKSSRHQATIPTGRLTPMSARCVLTSPPPNARSNSTTRLAAESSAMSVEANRLTAPGPA